MHAAAKCLAALWLHHCIIRSSMRKITNIAHCSRSYQYNFSASNYTFESFAMVSPKERADYNIKRRLNRANESPEERRQRRENRNQRDRDQRENGTPEEEQQRRQNRNERDCARRENETPDEQLAGQQHRNERDCARRENELILSRTIRIQPRSCRSSEFHLQ